MKKLPTTFRKEGFDFTQLKCEGNVALFRKTKEATGYSGFEVVVVQSHNGYRFGNEFFPPAEFMPRNEDWGSKGFTYTADDEAGALKQFEKLLRQQQLNQERLPKTPKLKLNIKK